MRREIMLAASALSAAAAVLLVAMLAIAIQAGGVTQQHFEAIAPLSDYLARFVAARDVITATLVFDNLFVIAYVLALALGLGALTQEQTQVPARIAIGGMITVGLLDMAENLHFLTMYAALAAQFTVSEGEIALQMWASLMKWHIAYLALFAASFVLSAKGPMSTLLVWSLRLVLPAIGVLISADLPEFHGALMTARYALMLMGFAMFAIVFWAQAESPPLQPAS